MPEVRHLRVDHGVQLSLPRQARGQACGKTILVGEHFVLHGTRAVALPVPVRHVEVVLSLSAWPEGTSRVGYYGPPEGETLVGAMCEALGLPQLASREGARLGVSLGGDLPLAAGLGSSAALAVALVRAFDSLTGQMNDAASVRARAHALEQIAHGRASGIDDAVIAWEQPLVFDPSAPRPDAHGPDPRFTLLDADEVVMPPLWIAWTRRERSTREAVAAVSALKEADPARFEGALSRAREAVGGCLDSLRARDWARLGGHLSLAHEALSTVGVVTSTHATMRRAALEAGAWGAKTTGAGCGGAMLVLGPPDLELAALGAIDGVEGYFFAGGVA